MRYTKTEGNFHSSFCTYNNLFFFIFTIYWTFLLFFNGFCKRYLFVVFQEMAEEEEDPLKIEVKEEYDSEAAEQVPATDDDEVIMRATQKLISFVYEIKFLHTFVWTVEDTVLYSFVKLQNLTQLVSISYKI